MADVNSETVKKPKYGATAPPEGWPSDLKEWPRPSELERDSIGRSGKPGAYGGIRIVPGQSRKETFPSADEAETQPLPTIPRNPEMEPMPPEKKGKLPAARTE